ncbi:MAG: hypothetical protein WA071_19385 [Undibacterium umbellatum]|uniref:hypothetical protein n=1 Tax=Undibacterium umbellatum TaxID=2762300 RepID=UPI003BB80DD7
MIASNDTLLVRKSSTRPSTRHGDFKKPALEDISLSKRWRSGYYSDISTGTAIGMAVGCILGAVNAALAVMIAPFNVPVLGLLVTHPLQAALVGAALGMIMGSVIGSLLGWGISSQTVEQLDTDLDSNTKFCPISRADDQQKVDAWKDQHGEYANI